MEKYKIQKTSKGIRVDMHARVEKVYKVSVFGLVARWLVSRG